LKSELVAERFKLPNSGQAFDVGVIDGIQAVGNSRLNLKGTNNLDVQEVLRGSLNCKAKTP